ncbi:two-component system nitrate/nitrite sensor histidine kinase NarX [Paraburkholderia fungorum]|uniref:histidine kinase n=1 Tax=Paraburkholderia fungorum TaxID=134537 RepID=UPI000D3FDBA4|nr:histidine kinase [Paraburkholderia fungorum]PRZ55844.1 two-component system nitrate/nitrite sensor histidine kinase NarX [Paraburkholderia fungorum]
MLQNTKVGSLPEAVVNECVIRREALYVDASSKGARGIICIESNDANAGIGMIIATTSHRRKELFTRTCVLLVGILLLVAMLYVCEHERGKDDGVYRSASIRLHFLIDAREPQSTRAAIVRSDALLNRWEQGEAPNREISGQLARITAGTPGEAAAAAQFLTRTVDEERLKRQKSLLVVECGVASLILCGVLMIVLGAREVFVVRLGSAFGPQATGVADIEGVDEVDRLVRQRDFLSTRLQSEVEESARLESVVQDYIKFADQSLELLHLTCVQLAESVPSRGFVDALLQRITGLAGIKRVALALTEPSAIFLGSDTVILHGEPAPHVIRGRTAQELMSLSGIRALSADDISGPVPVLAASIRIPSETYGVLICEGDPGTVFERRHFHLIETIASVVAHAIANLARDVRERRVVLLEERNAIARELHDSLAQSLSYMKIQLARLQASLPAEHSTTDVREIAQSIREGIDSAYRELRELLATFRTAVHVQGLDSTLEQMVDELAARTDVQISVDNRIRKLRFNVNEEIHVVQIVREALTNVMRHAKAHSAQVRLTSNESGVVVTIEDDGRGMSQGGNDAQRYGLSIMRERARILGGKVEIREGNPGSVVTLTFVPSSMRD